MPIIVKEKSEYTPLDPNYKPTGKNAHYAELDPIFATLKPAIDSGLDAIWNPESSIEEFRAAWSGNAPSPAGCPVEGEDVVTEKRMIPMRDGVEREICIYRAKEDNQGSGKKALVLRCHGGGWVIGGPNTEHPESLMLAGKTDSIVVVIDYRMAPEYKFPYAVNDCFDALKWCHQNAESIGGDSSKLIIDGGSAGAGLATVAALMAHDEGIPLIGQVLTWPSVCHPKFQPKDKYELESYQQNHFATILTAPRMEWFLDAYMPEPTDDWRLSPLLAPSLKGLPKTLVTVAGYDILRDEGLAYIERMKSEGVEVEHKVYKGFPHCPYGMVEHPEIIDYYNRIVHFVKKLTDTAPGGT